MSTEISKQAANEVGSLLDDYVVSPLKSELQDVLSQSQKTFNGTVTRERELAEQNLTGQIGALRALIEKTINEFQEIDIPDEIKDSEKVICNNITDLAKSVNKELTNLEQSLSKARQSLENTSQQNATVLDKLSLVGQDIKTSAESTGQNLTALYAQLAALKTQIDELTLQINDRFSQSAAATEKELEDLTQKMGVKLHESVHTFERELAKAAQQIESRISKSSQTALQKLAQLKRIEEDTHTETYRRIDSLTDQLNQNHTCVMERQDKMQEELDQYRSETEHQAEKRYKTLLTVSLVIWTANLMGIIALVLLYFL